MAASLGSPKKTPQAPVSIEGTQRAAGILLMKTVAEPFTIGSGGPGGGG